jgi:diacylglycerol O-acyltransferase/trehalose O-mycolyltransferase
VTRTVSFPTRRSGRTRVAALATGLLVAVGTGLGVAVTSGSGADAAVPVLTGGPVLVGGHVRTDDGSYPAQETVLSPGVLNVDVWSAAFQGLVRVQITLPADWSAAPTKTWPTLFTFMGGTGPTETFAGGGWTNNTDLDAFMAARDVLTAIPDDDHAGVYANWTGPSFTRNDSHPQFETFDTAELPQILTRDYRSSGRNVVLGDSLGGGGAMYIAAMHPGLFKAAASMSGLLDLQSAEAWPLIAGAELRVGENPWGPFGDPTFNANIWAAHNPINLVGRLKGIPLFVSAGSGIPDSLDPKAPLDGLAIEALARGEGVRFAAKATAAGDSITTDFYSTGAHTWPYWNREIPVAWKVLSKGLGLPAS